LVCATILEATEPVPFFALIRRAFSWTLLARAWQRCAYLLIGGFPCRLGRAGQGRMTRPKDLEKGTGTVARDHFGLHTFFEATEPVPFSGKYSLWRWFPLALQAA